MGENKSGDDHSHDHDHRPHDSTVHNTVGKKSNEKTSLLTAATGLIKSNGGYTEIPSDHVDVDHEHSHGGHHDDTHNNSCNGHGHSHGSNDHGHEHAHGHSEKQDEHHGDEEEGSQSHGHHDTNSSPSTETGVRITNNSSKCNADTSGFDANIQAAYLHVLTDLIQSAGVALAGLVLWFKPDWQIVDPLCTFMFSLLVLSYTIPLIQRITTVLLEGKPAHIDWHGIENSLKGIRGVQDVHDLHIWSISSSSTAMTVHIRVSNVTNHTIYNDRSTA